MPNFRLGGPVDALLRRYRAMPHKISAHPSRSNCIIDRLLVMKVLIDMKVSEVLKASTTDDLRKFGSYFELKNSFEQELNNKLEVNGWDSFFIKIKKLKNIVSSNKEALESACNKEDFKQSKQEVSDILTINVKAKSWTELKQKVDSFIFVFCSGIFDPYAHYEQTKLKKFKGSSKLEGIDIDISNEKPSLESVLKKYRR